MTKIVAIGVGSLVFGVELLRVIYQTPELRGAELWLVDLDPAAARRMGGLAAKLNEESGWDVIDDYHRAVPPERMPFAYRASDLFLAATRPEEGFGLPVLEALACGVPCLLSDTVGNREIAGDAATYFKDGDPEALAAAIPAALSPEARSRARRDGPALVKRFEPSLVAARLESAFSRALQGPERRLVCICATEKLNLQQVIQHGANSFSQS